jgi:hypothetical protein
MLLCYDRIKNSLFECYSELKRQMKAQKKADEKSQKATPVPSAKKEETTAAAGGGENDDQELDPNVSTHERKN